MKNNQRCAWVDETYEDYVVYHDREWGVPVFDDKVLFEFLILEGAQAGLSWSTILKKREGYRRAFSAWDYRKVAEYDEAKIQSLLKNPEIVRNQLKIRSTVTNARNFMAIQGQYGSFKNYIWDFVDGKPLQNSFTKLSELPASTPLSDRISKELKSKGFKFVGSTIVYAFMQAVGMVNDHTVDCFRYQQLLNS